MYEPWHPANCQNVECAVPHKNTPTSICLDASYAAGQCSSSPPVFICEKCAALAAQDIPDKSLIMRIIQPMGKMRTTCETKECKGQGKPCSVMCFSYECVKDNRYLICKFPPVASSPSPPCLLPPSPVFVLVHQL